MPEEQALLLLILFVGLILVVAIIIKVGLGRLGLPAIVGYIGLGLLLHSADRTWHFFSDGEREVLIFLGELGVICLLFRVGLESQLEKLIRQLRRASVLWASNFFVSGSLGFFTAAWILQLGPIPSLFVGTALSATSASIAVAIWQEAGALKSSNGELMLDVAEMDDISAIAMMAILFAVVPLWQSNPEANWLPVLGETAVIFGVKAVVFAAFCYFFSRYCEQPLTTFINRFEPAPDPTITVTGIGFIIAALAGLLGFSVAIGAFFAGLVFCRDPRAVKIDASFATLYELFVPFFFVGIGLNIDLSILATALGWSAILLAAAVLGKVVGVAIPVLLTDSWDSAALLGISMVPRAEILMIIMQRGLQLGDWAVSSQLFSATIAVSAATTILVPLVLRPLLQRWPQTE